MEKIYIERALRREPPYTLREVLGATATGIVMALFVATATFGLVLYSNVAEAGVIPQNADYCELIKNGQSTVVEPEGDIASLCASEGVSL